jgi:hypothetical protein
MVCLDERDRSLEEIEITPAMIAAGTAVLADWGGEVTPATLVEAIFLAMAKKHHRAPEKQSTMFWRSA